MSNILKDIQELKAQVKGFTKLIKSITKQPVVLVLYIDTFRNKGSPLANGKSNNQYI